MAAINAMTEYLNYTEIHHIWQINAKSHIAKSNQVGESSFLTFEIVVGQNKTNSMSTY